MYISLFSWKERKYIHQHVYWITACGHECNDMLHVMLWFNHEWQSLLIRIYLCVFWSLNAFKGIFCTCQRNILYLGIQLRRYQHSFKSARKFGEWACTLLPKAMVTVFTDIYVRYLCPMFSPKVIMRRLNQGSIHDIGRKMLHRFIAFSVSCICRNLSWCQYYAVRWLLILRRVRYPFRELSKILCTFNQYMALLRLAW